MRQRGSTVLICMILLVFMCPLASGHLLSVELSTEPSGGSRMNASDYGLQGMALMAQKNWSGLAALTDEGLALYPEDAELHCLKGYQLRKTGYFSEAADNVTFAIARDPKPIRYANRGFAYLAMGRYADALADADSAISLNGSYAPAYGVRALALLSTGNLTTAGEAVDTALSLDPENPFYWQVRGQVDAAGMNCSGAREAFQRSLSLDPTYDLPWPGFDNATADLLEVESRCNAGSPAPTRSAPLLVITMAAFVLAPAIGSRRKL